MGWIIKQGCGTCHAAPLRVFRVVLVSLVMVSCGIYEDVPLPVPSEESTPSPVEESGATNQNINTASDENGVLKYKVGIRNATQSTFRAEAGGTGKAKGSVLLFNKDAFSKDFELTIEPAVLPLDQMRGELGTSALIQAVSAQIRFGTTPLLDPGAAITVGIPLENASSHPQQANFAVVGLVTNVGEGSVSEIVWIPKSQLKLSAQRVAFQITKFGVYGVVAVDPQITVARSIPSKRNPLHYGVSGLYRVTLAGLPKVKPSDSTSSTSSLVVSEDTQMKATVSGPGVKEYKFAYREDRTDCSDAKYSGFLGVKKAISMKLGENGLKTLCVVGKNAEGRETKVFQHTWIKQTSKSYVLIDGKNTLDFSDKKSKTVTLNVKGAKAKEIKVSGLGNGFEFLGGKFPGTGGTCKKGGEDKSCTFVFNLKTSTAGTHTTVVQVTYFDGTEKKTLNLTLKATI